MTPLAGHAARPAGHTAGHAARPAGHTAGHAARPAGHTAGRGRRAEPREVATRGLRCASASVGVWAGSELVSPRPRAPGPRGEAEAKVRQPKARWSAQGSPKGSPQGPPKGPRVPRSFKLQGFKASRILIQRSPQSVPTGPGPELGARARGPGQGLGSGPGRAQHLGPEFGAPGPRGPG